VAVRRCRTARCSAQILANGAGLGRQKHIAWFLHFAQNVFAGLSPPLPPLFFHGTHRLPDNAPAPPLALSGKGAEYRRRLWGGARYGERFAGYGPGGRGRRGAKSVWNSPAGQTFKKKQPAGLNFAGENAARNPAQERSAPLTNHDKQTHQKKAGQGLPSRIRQGC
jgi:hypothetical protein